MGRKDRHTIMIVDDVPSNITILTEILMTDYAIVCATNGEDALKVASISVPDLILLDIMMPDMNGYEVCRRLKSDEKTKDILIIFLTAKTEEEDMVKGLELGSVDYISKPFSSIVLKHKLRIHIELKEHRENLEEIIKEKTIEISSSHQKMHQQMTERIQIQNKLIEQRAYFMQLFENSPQAIMIIDSDGKIIEINKGFEKIFGYKMDEIEGLHDKSLIVSEELTEENDTFIENILSGKIVSTETIRFHKDGSEIPVALLGYPAYVNNKVKGLFIMYKDISERKKFEEQLIHQAFHDSLTGIPNRLLLKERIINAFERAKRKEDYNFAVFMIDLDNFKSINDSMGHQAGDKFLAQFSSQLEKSMRATDTVARVGGDEFAILLEEFKDPDEVYMIAERISTIGKTTFFYKGREIKISASIGIVINSKDYDNPDKILRDADIALYRVKDTGKSSFKVFEKTMHKRTLDYINMRNELRHAITNNNIALNYQPIVSLSHQKLLGFEGLARWKHPEKGEIYPDHFIPVAEETGLIKPIGQAIIKEAVCQLKRWHDTIPGAEDLTMNVNISIKQFMDDTLVDFIIDTMEDIDLAPSFLNLEITESLLLDKTDYIFSTLSILRNFGINVVLDDFGTGYSSLSYIQDFKIDSIKIDRSFIVGIEKNGGSAEIVKTILSLCKNLELGVVAEGIETVEQLEILQSIDCEKGQGFYFSKPLDKDNSSRLIEEWDSQFIVHMT